MRDTMADIPSPGPNYDLCYAYRQLLTDKIGVQASRIDAIDKGNEVCTRDFESRLRSLEKYQSEQVGLSKGQATLWGIAIVAVSAIVSTLIKLYLEGVVA